jgi:hypothetical protein
VTKKLAAQPVYGLRILFQETLERKRDFLRSTKLYADCGLGVPLLDSSYCHA